MADRLRKETYYFTHDYNARSDVKIKKLLAKHGFQGYGIFWAIIEDLYQNANALPTQYDLLSFEYRTDNDTVKSIINDFDLFVSENGNFGSLSVQQRIDERDTKSEQARKSAFYRWGKIEKDANAMQTHSEGNAIKERKGEEKILNEKKVKSIRKPARTFEELKEIFAEHYRAIWHEANEANDQAAKDWIKRISQAIRDEPFDSVMKMQGHLTYKDITELMLTHTPRNVIDTLRQMDEKGDAYLAKYKSLRGTLKNWMKRPFIKAQ